MAIPTAPPGDLGGAHRGPEGPFPHASGSAWPALPFRAWYHSDPSERHPPRHRRVPREDDAPALREAPTSAVLASYAQGRREAIWVSPWGRLLSWRRFPKNNSAGGC